MVSLKKYFKLVNQVDELRGQIDDLKLAVDMLKEKNKEYNFRLEKLELKPQVNSSQAIDEWINGPVKS